MSKEEDELVEKLAKTSTFAEPSSPTLTKAKDPEVATDQGARDAWAGLANDVGSLGAPPAGSTPWNMTNPNSVPVQAAASPEQRARLAQFNAQNDPLLGAPANPVAEPQAPGFNGPGVAGFDMRNQANQSGFNVTAGANQPQEVFAKPQGQPGQPMGQPMRGGGGGAPAVVGPDGVVRAMQQQQSAQGDVGEAQAQIEANKGIAAGLQGQAIGQRAQDLKAKAAAQDAAAANAQQQIDQASQKAAAMREDPDHWWNSQSNADKARLTVANFLGELGAGLSHTENNVMPMINKHVDNDIAAQRKAIEQAHGRVADMHGSLAEMYRRFGNLNQAEDAAHIMHLQQLGAEADEYGSGARSDLARAQSDTVKAQLATQIEEYKKRLAASMAGHQLSPREQAEIDKLRAETGKTNAETATILNGKPGEAGPPDAPEFTFGQAIKSYIPGTPEALMRDQLNQHNAGAVGVVHKGTGLRGEGAIKGAEPYTASVWTPRVQVRERNQALRNNFGRAVQAEMNGEPPPEGFEEEDQ